MALGAYCKWRNICLFQNCQVVSLLMTQPQSSTFPHCWLLVSPLSSFSNRTVIPLPALSWFNWGFALTLPSGQDASLRQTHLPQSSCSAFHFHFWKMALVDIWSLYLSLTWCFLPMKYKAGSWKQNPRSLLRNYSWDSRRSQRISNFSLGWIWSSRLSPCLLSPLTPTSTTPWGLSSPAAPLLGIFSRPSRSLTYQKTSRRVQSNHSGRLPHLDGFSWDERLSPWPWFVCRHCLLCILPAFITYKLTALCLASCISVHYSSPLPDSSPDFNQGIITPILRPFSFL